MDVVDPDDVVISVLAASPFGHPHSSAMDAYEKSVGASNIHCTSRHGTIRIFGNADGSHRIFPRSILINRVGLRSDSHRGWSLV